VVWAGVVRAFGNAHVADGRFDTLALGSPLGFYSDYLAGLAVLNVSADRPIYGVPTCFIAELSPPRFAEFDLSRGSRR
jgi:hypothetical protein